MSRCSRVLETIIQSRWVDCFEARVKAIGIEQPFLSNTETKMCALREACTVLQWSEKELRNKLYVWSCLGPFLPVFFSYCQLGGVFLSSPYQTLSHYQ